MLVVSVPSMSIDLLFQKLEEIKDVGDKFEHDRFRRQAQCLCPPGKLDL